MNDIPPTETELAHATEIVKGTLAYTFATGCKRELRIETVEEFSKQYDELCVNSLESMIEDMKTKDGCVKRLARLTNLREAGFELLVTKYQKLSEPERGKMAGALRWMKMGIMDSLMGTVLMMEYPTIREKLDAMHAKEKSDTLNRNSETSL